MVGTSSRSILNTRSLRFTTEKTTETLAQYFIPHWLAQMRPASIGPFLAGKVEAEYQHKVFTTSVVGTLIDKVKVWEHGYNKGLPNHDSNSVCHHRARQGEMVVIMQ